MPMTYLYVVKASEIYDIFNLFDDFYNATRSKLGVQKTSVLHVTHARNNINNHSACNFLSDEIKFCGLFYSIDNFNKLSDRNWSYLYRRAITIVEKLEQRRLNLPGKILVLNCKVLSLFHYVAGVFTPPPSIIINMNKLIFSYVWHPASRTMVKREGFYLNGEKGGWDLSHLKCKADALDLANGVLRCTEVDYDHPRLPYLKYFLGVRLRQAFPNMYTNNMPHALTVGVDNPYFRSFQTFCCLKDKILPLVPSLPSTRQLYVWLLEKVMQVKELQVKHPPVATDEREAVWRVVRDNRLSAKHQDFQWRLASGALKTGDVVRKWNIPGAQTICLFCQMKLETPYHLFVECPELRKARSRVKELATQRYGVAIDISDEKVMLSGLFNDVLGSYVSYKIKVLIITLNKEIWNHRCRCLFDKKKVNLNLIMSCFENSVNMCRDSNDGIG